MRLEDLWFDLDQILRLGLSSLFVSDFVLYLILTKKVQKKKRLLL